jgi:hypothetical protein
MIQQLFTKPIFAYHYARSMADAKNAVAHQKATFARLMNTFYKTKIGKVYNIHKDITYTSFKESTPLHTYDELEKYIEDIIQGQSDVLWQGRPKYWAKTSGTTNANKLIPITKASFRNQRFGPLRSFSHVVTQQRIAHIASKKQLLFSDGSIFSSYGGIKSGALSSLMANDMPTWAKGYLLPSAETQAEPDLQTKLTMMLSESLDQSIGSIVAMPIWLLQFAEKARELTGKRIADLYPDLKLLLLSGMDYEPYLPLIREHFSPEINIFQVYPSSEGFIAYQDRAGDPAMQLVCDMGMFYEFVPLDKLYTNHPTRYPLWEVKKDVEYALVITACNGLFTYIIGDTVIFKTLDPYRIIISGRVKEYISLFGENLRANHAQAAILATFKAFDMKPSAYTVMPQINHQPLHHWYIESDAEHIDATAFANRLHKEVSLQNANYFDCARDRLIDIPSVTFIAPNSLSRSLQLMGKGMQSKMKTLWDKEMILPGIND